MSALDKCLDFLSENISSSNISTIHKCEIKVKEIEQICNQRLTKNELDEFSAEDICNGFYCSLLLKSPKSLLSFLSKTTTSRQHKSTKEQILVFLSSFLPRIKNQIQPYFNDVLKVSLNIVAKDHYSKNKDKALQVADQIIIFTGSSSDKVEWINKLLTILLEELAKSSSNTTSTVRGHVLQTLGILARYHKARAERSASRWFDIMLKELEREMISSKDGGDLQVIEGSLNGLHGLLFNFYSIAIDEKRLDDIHKYSRMALKPQTKLSRYGVPIAAMKLFKDHSHLFSTFLIQDYRTYYGALEVWFQHNNPHLKHSAHMAIEAFFLQISRTSQEDSAIQSKDMFLYFIQKFEKMIKSDSLSSKEMSLAVQGYGLLAGPCKRFLNTSDVSYMCMQMLSRCEHLFLGSNELNSDKLHRLPTFVDALGNIVQQIQTNDGKDDDFQLPESCLHSLEQVCVLMIENYPRLHNKFLMLCHSSLLSCMIGFATTPRMLQRFQFCLAYQGLIRSCSCDVILGEDREKLVLVGQDRIVNLTDDDAQTVDDIKRDTRTVTFGNYVSLWIFFLQGMGDVKRPNVKQQVVDGLSRSFVVCFVDAVIEIIEKLNLNTVHTTADDVGANLLLSQTDSLQAENLADFRIFINLCDLCHDVLASCSKSSCLKPHVYKLAQTFVAFSTKYPVVSGFYKLLTALMRVCEDGHYSDQNQLHSSSSTDDDTLILHYIEKKQCLALVQKFVIELSHRLKQFKDELLNSALTFVLSIPHQIACDVLQSLISPLKIACQVGNDYLPLALSALEAIHRWKLISPVNKSLLSDVVSQLEPFLHFSKDVVLSEKSSISKKRVSSRKPKFFKRNEDFDEINRKKVRSQVMKLFGNLGSCVVHWLKDEHSNSDDCVAPWDSSITVDYAVPFRDMKPVVRLDRVLWRVMHVAKTSSDRKAKISACELLHSIVVFMIGKSAQRENAEQTSLVAPLYKKLFPVLFSLACDHDQVCRQVFRPLINQVIHWFTKNKQFENPSTAALLNAIMDGLINRDNAGLRELCARSLSEFLSWSVKQNSSDDGYKNAKSILKRIYSFALHPSPDQRLGAYLAFNSLYKVFRENNKMVDDFTLEIFIVFMNSLSLSHYDDTSYGTIKLCEQAITHLERIITTKHEMLRAASSSRRGLRSPVTLSSVVSWLFDRVGRPQTECRRQCMRLFIAFVKLLPYKEKSPLGWVENLLKKEGGKGISKRFEHDSDGNGISVYPRLTDISNKFSMQSVSNWFDLVLAATECYLWLFEEGLLSPEQAFNNNSEAKIFVSLEYFVSHVIACDASRISLVFQSRDNAGEVCSPQEKKVFIEQKCFLICRFLHFVVFLLQSCEKDAKIIKIIPDSLWRSHGIPFFLSSTLVVPSSLGFDTSGDSDVITKMTKLSSDAIVSLLKIAPNLPKPYKGMKETLIKEISSKFNEIGRLDEVLPRPFGDGKQTSSSSLNIVDLLKALSSLFKTEIFSNVLQETEGTVEVFALARRCFDKVFASVVQTESVKDQVEVTPRSLSSGLVQVGESLLKFVFAVDGVFPSCVVEKLLSSTRLPSVDGESHFTSQAALFISTYSNELCSHLCSNPGRYFPLLCESSNRQGCALVINSVLDHLTAKRSERRKHAGNVCEALLKEWGGGLACWWRGKCDEVNSDSLNNLVSILRKLLMLDLRVFNRPESEEHQNILEMFTTLLSSRQELTFKNKLLDLLSSFCNARTSHERIEDALERLVAQHFPLTSREFEPSSTSFCVYSQAISKLLTAMQDSGATMLLKVVATVLCREKDHVMKDEIQSAIQNTTSRILPSSRQAELLVVAYCLHRDIANYSPSFRSLIVEQVLVAIASRCDVTAIRDFFIDHVVEVMSIIREDIFKVSDSKLEEELSRKASAYRLMELLFSLVPESQIKSDSLIGQAYAATSQSQDSLLKSFMKCATRDRKVSSRREGPQETRRVFHCAVFNAIIAAVICTQQEVTWYKAFLFDDSPKKSQFFLDDVIDCEKEYYFLVEITEPLKKRSRFAAIRKQKQENESASVGYMASVYDSSLSEDLSVFDSNAGRPLTKSTLTDSDATAQYSESMETDKTTAESGVSLECDELNMHECMPNMVALIRHMEQNSIGFPRDPCDNNLPSFMSNMVRKLSSSESSRNVRIFIARLIVNCASSFKRFAAHLIVSLTNLLLRNDLGSNGINYMVCDVMATVLSWNDVAIPDVIEDSLEGRTLVQAVVEKLCQGIHLHNRSIARHNLELVKTVLECWGKRIKIGIDPSVIYGLCGAYDDGSLRSFVGLQLLGAFLSNGIPPYTSSFTVDRTAYFKRLFGYIAKKRKEAYESASEAAGMTLEYLCQVEGEVDGEIHDLVSAIIKTTHSQAPEKFITCLHKVALHHSKIVDEFATKVFFLLPKLQGDLRSKALDIIAQRGRLIPDLYRELKAKDFASMLAMKDDNLQLICCRLCRELLPQVFNYPSLIETHEALLYFLPYIFEHYVAQQNPLCRQEVLDIATEVYDFEMNLDAANRNESITSAAKLVLVKLLSDDEEVVRNQVVNFWNSEEHLPIEPRNKLHQIVLLLYEPAHEDDAFLRSAVMLLLQSASLSPDYNLPLFPHPLSKCSFQEYPVDHSWRSRHVGTSPMFVDTLQSSAASATVVKATQQQQLVKATQQSLQFSDTLAGGRNTYNWMTGNSLDTFASLPTSESDVTKSSLIATSRRDPQRVKSLYAILKSSSTKEAEASTAESKSSVAVDVTRLRRRFLKESKASMFKYARLQEIKKKEQERSKKDLKRRLENEVQLHRKYREGELPDIEIPNRALVAPLAAACQYDANLSRLLAPLLVSSILKSDSKQGQAGDDLIEDILKMLSRSEEKSPLLVGFVEDICFLHHSLPSVDFSSIASASLVSGKEELGISLMEQILLSRDANAGEPVRKRKRMQGSPDVEVWFEIARLYKSLGDYDVIQGIFHGRGVSAATSLGLKLEASGSFKEARKVYIKALNDEQDAKEIEKDLWEDCLLNCTKHLCSWDQVDKMCRDHLSSYDQSSTSLEDAWKHKDYLERYLDSALEAKLILLLQGNTDAGDSLASFMDDAMTGGREKRDVVEKKYAEHLAMLYIHQEDYSRAKYYLHRAMDELSLQWTLSDPGSQETLLKSLSRFSDVIEFINVMQSSDSETTALSSNQLLSKWSEECDITSTDSITSSYHHVMHRSFLLQRLSDHHSSSSSAVDRCKISMRLGLMEAASLRRNFSASQKILSYLDEVYDQIEKDETLSIDLAHKTAFHYHAQARHRAAMSGSSPSNLKYLLAAHQSLSEQNSVVNGTKNKQLTSSHLLLLANCYHLMAHNLDDASADDIAQVRATLPLDQGDGPPSPALLRVALSHYEKSCSAAEAIASSNDKSLKVQYRAYLDLSEFCHQRIVQPHCEESPQLADLLTQYVIKAMKIDGSASSLASLKFPLLLQLLDEFPHLRDSFINYTNDVPSWMFLAWLGHMMAFLDRDFASSLHPIVIRISSEYPQAVVYPFTTSLPGYKFVGSKAKENKKFVKRLKKKLEDEVPLADDFVKNLRYVADPYLYFQDWKAGFSDLMQDRDKQNATASEVIEDYQLMYEEMFDCSGGDSSLYESSDGSSQLLRSKFAKKFKSEFDKLFGGYTATKLVKMNTRLFNNQIKGLLEKMKNFKLSSPSLKAYSQWLANYQPLQHGERDLEIPGQYHGRSRPLLDYHVTIAGFSDKVLMMASIRKPCRIGIRGSDMKEHRFLVKGGEDMRQDQRIESMFQCFNDLFADDVECRKREMSIVTYQVVPISAKVGVIEWMDHVTTYWDFVDEQARRMSCDNKLHELQKVDWVPVSICKKVSNVMERYGRLMSDVSYTDAVANYNRVAQKLPPHIFRNAYLHLAANPESFIRLRKRFVMTYSIMCVTHWLLGIGDRHTTNFVISTSSGRSVGIDFGHAFGSATEVLPVPELVPFRLTRQISGLLSPHDVKHGEIRQVMIRCLAAIRAHSYVILPILDVFIQDPSVDWMKFAKKKNLDVSGTDDVCQVYARRKINIVKWKLEGGNPAHITCDELEQNRAIGPYKKNYVSVAKGGKSDTFRSSVAEKSGLDVAVQVDCLLDQATDPNVLGRMWGGWKSWC